MASGPYSFIDIAVLEDVRARFAAGDALAILNVDLEAVIWANGGGAELLGQRDIEAVMGAPSGLSLPARRQIGAAPGFPRTVRNRTVAVRLATGLKSRTVMVQVSSLTLPRGEPALLLAVAQDAQASEAIHAGIVEGFREAGYFAALLDADAKLSAASQGFDELGIAGETLASLVTEVSHERDRLVKRLIPARDGMIPAGIARLTDEPPLHLLIAIDDVVEDAQSTEAAEIVPFASLEDPESDFPEPSESDLIDRIAEDSAEQKAGDRDDDHWYFSPDQEQPVEIAARTAAPARDFSRAAPIRFVWRTDADGELSFISPEFIDAIGAASDTLVGRPFREVAETLNLDPEREIIKLLERRDTWSGRTVSWPIGGTEMVAPVDLAALPAYSRDRSFEGFRGFGVLRLSEAKTAPPAAEAAHAVDDAQEVEDDPFRGETPALHITDNPDRRSADKVIRLAEHRPPAQEPPATRQLSAGERHALEEIRLRLSRDYEAEQAENEDDAPAPADSGESEEESTAPGFVAENDTEAPADIEEDASEPETEAAPDLLSPGRHQQAVDPDLISGLPLPILIHAGDELYFANREFLNLTGYASLDQIRREGGLDRLFVEQDEESGPHLRTLGGDTFAVDAHLQSVRWNDHSALLLSVRRIETPLPAPEAPPPAESSADLEDMERRVEEMRTIIDTATDGVVLIAADATIRSISRPAEALFGIDSAEVEGKPFTSLFAIESQKSASDYLAGLAENGVASVLNDGREVIGREAEGRFIPLFMTIGRLPAENGYCAVVRDITQWKRAEEELTQARAQAERSSSQKTEFLARVSHEIRTPLNAIIGFSELMMDEKFGPIGSDRYRDYLRDINRSGNHVLDLVNDLLDISKIEAGEQEMNYEAVSLNDALAECVAMMQPQANRERVIIRSSLASRLPEVVADLRSVRQIALNLLSNAIRYTQAGGQVIVSTSYEPSGDVVMRVRDTGIGMTLSEIDQALKPFKQINALKRGRHDGTGLGLPLTKAMVEANRARFTIASTPGEGTLVEVAFPSTRVLAD